jgi:uncharacterized protein YneF (UPF0154 family)
MGVKNFLMRKMMQSKMKDVPPLQQEKIFAMIEKNPDFFQKIAVEVQEKMKEGKDQMAATMEVMSKYQNDLKGMI